MIFFAIIIALWIGACIGFFIGALMRTVKKADQQILSESHLSSKYHFVPSVNKTSNSKQQTARRLT